MSFPSITGRDAVDDLRDLIAQHGLTHGDVATMACVSVKTVESWLASKDAASHRKMHARHLRCIRYALPQHMTAKRGRKA